MSEVELYGPVKRFLEKQGYAVKGEIGACDVVAVRGDEAPVVVELKERLSLALILQAVDRFVNFDLVVHRWDLARAAGLDETMPPEEVARLTEEVAGFGDAARSPGVFGPEIDVPPDADAQTALLGQLGRRP